MLPVYISNVGLSLGESEPVTALKAFCPEEQLSTLATTRYSKSSKSQFELIKEAVANTFADCETDREEIDLVIITTSTMLDEESGNYDLVGALPAELGMPVAHIVGITFNACSNFISALSMAQCYINTGQYRKILIINTDKPREVSRIMPASLAVLGDGASACIVSARPSNVKVIGIALINNSFIWKLDPGKQQIPYLGHMSKTIKKLFDRLIVVTGWDARALDCLITNNYNESVLDVFENIINNNEKRVIFRDNIGKYGHCYASDLLINLATILRESKPREGQKAVLLSSGMGSFGMAACEFYD